MMRFVGRIEGGQFASNPPAERYEQCQVLWRGFISNPGDIRSQAVQRGVTIRSTSTGELIALAYRWWGDAIQTYLTGEYSVAVFDERTSVLLLAPDAFGLAPMFYRLVPTGVIFGSHLEDLAADDSLDDLDEEYVAD